MGDREAVLGPQPADQLPEDDAQLTREQRGVGLGRHSAESYSREQAGNLNSLPVYYSDRRWHGPLQVDRALEHDPGDPAGDARRLDHADRDAGHLPRHPPRPAGPLQQLLPALDDPRLPGRLQRPDRQPRPARRHLRPGPDLQPRLRHLHGRLAAAGDRLDDGRGGGALPGRLPHRPGSRRRLPARQRGGDHHRRLPGQPARDGARDQQHRRRQRHVRRPRARRAAGADRLAPGLPDLGPGRPLRHRLGLPEARGAQRAAAGHDRLVGQRHLRPRPGPGDGRGHLRDPSLRRLADRLGEPAGARSCSPARSPRWSPSC